jgi:anti-sigma factor (TIGR02949 family)
MSECEDMDCKECLEALDDFVDRELAAEDFHAIERHLDRCPPCSSEFEFERAVLDQIRSKLSGLDVPADLKARIFEKLDNR